MAKKKTSKKTAARKPAKSAKPKKAAKPLMRKKRASAGSSGGNNHGHGSFVWHEINTPSVDGSRRFYTSLFGWTTHEMPMGPGRMYTIFKNGSTDLAGIMHMSGPEWDGVPPHWMAYVAVDDVDATADKCVALGGKICVPPMDIPVGRFAVLNDPQGATISIYKSARR